MNKLKLLLICFYILYFVLFIVFGYLLFTDPLFEVYWDPAYDYAGDAGVMFGSYATLFLVMLFRLVPIFSRFVEWLFIFIKRKINALKA